MSEMRAPPVFYGDRDHGEIFPALCGVGDPSHKKWRTHPSLISHLPSCEVPTVLIHRRVENRESLRVYVKAYAFVVAKLLNCGC